MLSHASRVAAFAALGRRLASLTDAEITDLAARARSRNGWFDRPNVQVALAGVAHLLAEPQLSEWAGRYPAEPAQPRQIGVVMAGNIPLVGFHDLLCVLVSGHTLLAKPSKDDTVLMQWIAQELTQLEPAFAERIQFVERLNAADAYIATGSDNTARYFEYYFKNKPHLIRRNRSSLGILTGQEPAPELALLAPDIFQYYGLGCRNLSKLYVPAGYDFVALLDTLQVCSHVLDNHKYQNNYDYNKSILLVNAVPHYDAGFALFTEREALVSPISVVHYSTYTSEVDLVDRLATVAAQTQVIASAAGRFAGSVPFGQAQHPSVTDYADGIDTMEFLGAEV